MLPLLKCVTANRYNASPKLASLSCATCCLTRKANLTFLLLRLCGHAREIHVTYSRKPDGKASCVEQVPVSVDAEVNQQSQTPREHWLSRGQPWSRARTQALVETAMLAAVTGLSYLLASIIKLEGYLGYVLPFPLVISAMRSGPAASWRTMTCTVFLLLALLGPVRAMSYVLTHGMFAFVLGASWASKLPWVVSIPAAAITRVAGSIAYLFVASWTLNENLFALAITNATAAIEQICQILGTSGTPSLQVVAITMLCALIVNSTFYVVLMHMLYEVVLLQMGYSTGRMPRWVQQWLFKGM